MKMIDVRKSYSSSVDDHPEKLSERGQVVKDYSALWCFLGTSRPL